MKANCNALKKLAARRRFAWSRPAAAFLSGWAWRAGSGGRATDAAVQRGLAFLAARQADDGSYGSKSTAGMWR